MWIHKILLQNIFSAVKKPASLTENELKQFFIKT